jgi:hypothetical protein
LTNLGEVDIVEGNRLDFVPKNDDISRSICVEPTLNMFFQLGFADILNSRLKEFAGIDLENQQFKIESWRELVAGTDLSQRLISPLLLIRSQCGCFDSACRKVFLPF